MLRRAVGIVIFITSFCATALTQELPRQSATAPASQPLAPADSATPKGTLTLFSRATQSGDSSAVQGLFNATTPQEQKLANALVERATVYAKFRQAAVKAFGEDAAAQLAGTSDAEATESEERIKQADVKIENDKATVLMKTQLGEPQPEPVKLERVNGAWKLSMANLIAGMQAAEIEERLQEMKTLTDIVVGATDEIGQGKYKTANEVNDAIRAKLATIMLQQATRGPASRPSTGPMEP